MNGYMTYISAGIIALATIAHGFKWIDDQTYNTLIGIGGAGGVAFLRRAVANNHDDTAKGQAVIAEKVGVTPAAIKEHIGPLAPPVVS